MGRIWRAGFWTERSIECPDHGGLFDIRDGAVRGGPDTTALATFAVRETDGRVEADLPD